MNKLYEVQFGTTIYNTQNYCYAYWDLDVAERTYETYRDAGWNVVNILEHDVVYDKYENPILQGSPRIVKSFRKGD